MSLESDGCGCLRQLFQRFLHFARDACRVDIATLEILQVLLRRLQQFQQPVLDLDVSVGVRDAHANGPFEGLEDSGLTLAISALGATSNIDELLVRNNSGLQDFVPGPGSFLERVRRDFPEFDLVSKVSGLDYNATPTAQAAAASV